MNITIGTTFVTIFFVLPFVYTYFTTCIQYWSSLRKHTSNEENRKPVQIPYTIPFLGNALSFLTAPRPGYYWSRLFSWLPPSTGVCTLVFFGQKTHFVYNDAAVHTLFRAKHVRTEGFRNDVLVNGFGLEQKEAHKYYGTGETPVQDLQESGERQQERINQHYLLQASSVSELTREFMRLLQQIFDRDLERKDGKTISLYAWLRDAVFEASTTALFGESLLIKYPGIKNDFFNFERRFVSCLFGLPRWIAGDIYEVRERLISQMAEWHEFTHRNIQDAIPDPMGTIVWDPETGSRFHRARRILYRNLEMTPRARASADLSTMFGLSGNAIPCIGWMLLHLLDPKGNPTVLPRILSEISSSKTKDGDLEISKLLTLPLLNSTFHEVMRLYLDVPVTRQLTEDLTLPLGKMKGSVKLGKGDVVQAPSWISHHDDSLWPSVPANLFYAERFLALDPVTNKMVFTTSGSAGKFFPFGGGKSICPGRNFAKQEVLGAVAALLSKVNFEALEFIDGDGNDTKVFPFVKEGYAGNGMVLPRGDLKVRIRRL